MEGSAGVRSGKAVGPEGVLKKYLGEAGLPTKTISSWMKAEPRFTGKFLAVSAPAVMVFLP